MAVGVTCVVGAGPLLPRPARGSAVFHSGRGCAGTRVSGVGFCGGGLCGPRLRRAAGGARAGRVAGTVGLIWISGRDFGDERLACVVDVGLAGGL